MKFIKRNSLYLAWLITASGMLLSLNFSEIKHMPVCNLCWYQRICLYSLAIILGIASYRNDRTIKIYAIPLALIGLFFAGYQYAEQMIPGFEPLPLCGQGLSCSTIHLQWLGFITFPLLSAMTFLVVIILLGMS